MIGKKEYLSVAAFRPEKKAVETDNETSGKKGVVRMKNFTLTLDVV
jgi:hypothetical protein